MPGHHSASLHNRKAGQDPLLSVSGIEADHIVNAAEALVASSKRLELAALTHLVTIEMSPDALLSPSALSAKSFIYVCGYRDQPEDLRVECEFLL